MNFTIHQLMSRIFSHEMLTQCATLFGVCVWGEGEEFYIFGMEDDSNTVDMGMLLISLRETKDQQK